METGGSSRGRALFSLDGAGAAACPCPLTPACGHAAFGTDVTARTKLVPTSLWAQVPRYIPVWDMGTRIRAVSSTKV